MRVEFQILTRQALFLLPAAGQALDAAYFAQFPDLDRAYSPGARAEAKTLAEKLRAEASTLSHEAFVLRVAEIAALADNGHTTIGENAWRKNTPRLPLRTYWFADGLYVLRARPTLTPLLGARIDAIDGQGVEEVFAKLRRYEGGTDEHRRLRLLPVFESPRFLMSAGIAHEGHALTLSGALADGTHFSQRIEAEDRGRSAPVTSSSRLLFPSSGAEPEGMVSVLAPGGALPVSLQEASRLFTISPLPSGGLYIALGLSESSDNESVTDFLAEVLARCAREKPTFVVIDFRMNGGGDYTQTYPFMVALDDVLRGKSHVYALTSAWTFSAAITSVAALKTFSLGELKIVGEPVGDRLDFWAEGEHLALPNSNVSVFYTTGRHVYNGVCDAPNCFWLNRFYPVRVESLTPDIPATMTFAAYSARRDSAMDAVLAREAARR